ncbi:MAG: peptidylprolyl isomerase [Chloroflexi bacterium]|nr:peptidylprolyl isomerase [Chloroflexota bacterium]
MAKSKAERTLTQKQISRGQKLERQKRLAQLGAAGVIFAVLAILAYGYWQVNVQEPASPVATVNGVSIRKGDFETMVRYRSLGLQSLIQLLDLQIQTLNPADPSYQSTVNYLQAQIQEVQSQLINLEATVLEEMVESLLLEEYAAEQGISVSAEEVRRAIELQVGFDREEAAPTATPLPGETPTPGDTPTPATISRAEFESQYRDFIKVLIASGISENFYRNIIRQELLRQKVADIIGQEVSPTAPQVHARHILLSTQEEAEQARERLLAGEDFSALAQEISQDQFTKDFGGDLGWFPYGERDPAFDDVAFALEPGEISEAVTTSAGFHIIQILEKEESRELTPLSLQRKKAEAFLNWLEEQKAQASIEYFWAPEVIPLG